MTHVRRRAAAAGKRARPVATGPGRATLGRPGPTG
jgi:hypothetical protein